MDQETKAEFAKLHERLDVITTSVLDMRKDVGTLKSEVKVITKRLDHHDHMLGLLATAVNANSQEIKSLRHTVTAMPRLIREEIEDSFDQTYGKMLDDHEERISGLEKVSEVATPS